MDGIPDVGGTNRMTTETRRRKRPSTIGRARRVLVLDDDAGSRRITKYVLEQAGHVCEVVENARSALAAMATFAPDVVLYEWDLRGDAGIGLASRLRAVSARLGRALIVIAASAVDEPSAFRAREGVDDYFTKPLDLGVLARLIGKT
jgi:DNA-binding response OmpR family regulator